MVQSRRSGYEDKSTPQLRSEILNLAERATLSQRELRTLVRITAELAGRLDRLEAAARAAAEDDEAGDEPAESG